MAATEPSDRLKAKIAALRAKTTAAGCTEAEALAAAEVAARLMREHGLSQAELVMTEASADEPSSRMNWRHDLSSTIANVTNTAAIWCPPRTLLFIGRAPGPEIASYLRDLCLRTVEAEVRRFKAGEFYLRRRKTRTRRAATTDFTEAMVERLQQRLRVLFLDALDPVALEAASRAMHSRFRATVSFGDRSERDTRFDAAAQAGRAAADRARLDRGVTDKGDAAIGLIGRSA